MTTRSHHAAMLHHFKVNLQRPKQIQFQHTSCDVILKMSLFIMEHELFSKQVMTASCYTTSISISTVNIWQC